MINKTIHYCWFGKNKKPKSVLKCIKSWKKYAPDFEMIEWNEDNFEIANCPLYVQQAYTNGKWAFVTDYVRLCVVYDFGGFYMDTDVQLIRQVDDLCKYDCFFGVETGGGIATGLMFGAKQQFWILKEMIDTYKDRLFVMKNGEYDLTPCPVMTTNIMKKHGYKYDIGMVPGTIQNVNGITIFPPEYFCPISFETREIKITEKTYSIHRYDASWYSSSQKRQYQKTIIKKKIKNILRTWQS